MSALSEETPLCHQIDYMHAGQIHAGQAVLYPPPGRSRTTADVCFGGARCCTFPATRGGVILNCLVLSTNAALGALVMSGAYF